MAGLTKADELEYEALDTYYSENPLPKGGRALTSAEARDLITLIFGPEQQDARMTGRSGRPRLGERRAGRSPSIHTRLSEEQHAAFEGALRRTGLTRSEFTRRAVMSAVGAVAGAARVYEAKDEPVIDRP